MGRKLRAALPTGLSQSERPDGSHSTTEVRDAENWMNNDPWAGVLEPILLLLFIAMIGALLGLL